MEEEGVPSTTLREISLLQMLSESNHIVKCAHSSSLLALPAGQQHSCRVEALRQPAVLPLAPEHMPLTKSLLPAARSTQFTCRLLCVEHLEENGKPCLYLVFEYLSTDLKKYMDRNGKGPNHPLPPELVKVGRAGNSRLGTGRAALL